MARVVVKNTKLLSTQIVLHIICNAHARRHFANVIKAMGKGNKKAIESSVAYKSLVGIGTIYKLEKGLKTLSPKERLKVNQYLIHSWRGRKVCQLIAYTLPIYWKSSLNQ